MERTGNKVLNTLREVFHTNALSAAIFFGRPGWAGREANALGLSEEDQHEVVTQAHISAASRAEIIHGDHKGATWHAEQAFNISNEHSRDKLNR